MSSKSIQKDFLISSTPVQPAEDDSGYFGSIKRKSFYGSSTNDLNTFSPIQELYFKNLSDNSSSEHDFDQSFPQPKFKKNILDYENFMSNAYESSSLGVSELSELEFVCDSDIKEHNSSEQIFNALSFSEDTESQNILFKSSYIKENNELFETKPSNLRQENFYGFKGKNELLLHNTHMKHTLQSLTACNQTKVDFLHSLNKINCLSLISCILSYLSAKELCIASCVNKEWNQIIHSDSYANCRRKGFIKERNLFFNGPSKENRLGMKSRSIREPKNAFSDLTNNAEERISVAKDLNTRFQSFIKESQNGHLKLRKCPKCSYASKSLNENNYKCTHCSHIFCIKCLNPVLKNHTCEKSQLPNIIIGSKKSKKNLKRL